MREIILDTETTGLDPKSGHRIIEIGALEMHNKILSGNSFHYYVNPERDVPMEAFQVHGISSEYLKDKPRFHEIADAFLEFIYGAQLVIHNASFDMMFLNHELDIIQKPTIDYSFATDTLIMARKKFPGQRNNLDALCKRFGIDNSHRKYHGALKDAALLAEVYIELTGGRQIKFDMQNTSKLEEDSIAPAPKYSHMNFLTIEASKEEIESHTRLLKDIKG
ncbi:MAG: DNA polymerase III subunit epsilon [Alphaproteobacteria bacterium]|nr:DNA polymerase III subunit epsilon [Alphaproteobacteria bacterium]